MKIRRLVLSGSLFLATIATAAAAMTAGAVEPLPMMTEAPAVARAEVALDHGALVAQTLSRWSEDAAPRSTPEAAASVEMSAGGGSLAAPLACGSSIGIASPPNGISGQGSAGDMMTALFLAYLDALNKISAYANVECQDCEIPGACTPGVSLIDSQWSWDAFQTSDGTWYAVATYKGPILGYCTPCE